MSLNHFVTIFLSFFVDVKMSYCRNIEQIWCEILDNKMQMQCYFFIKHFRLCHASRCMVYDGNLEGSISRQSWIAKNKDRYGRKASMRDRAGDRDTVGAKNCTPWNIKYRNCHQWKYTKTLEIISPITVITIVVAIEENKFFVYVNVWISFLFRLQSFFSIQS